jgi:hypothetical protein
LEARVEKIVRQTACVAEQAAQGQVVDASEPLESAKKFDGPSWKETRDGAIEAPVSFRRQSDCGCSGHGLRHACSSKTIVRLQLPRGSQLKQSAGSGESETQPRRVDNDERSRRTGCDAVIERCLNRR